MDGPLIARFEKIEIESNRWQGVALDQALDGRRGRSSS
jgi:hypothetical protein